MPFPNIVLVILDACRRDALRPYAAPVIYGDQPPSFLSRVVTEGVVVEDCQSTSSCTAISVATILTGIGPHEHGITTLVGASLRDGVPSLAAQLRRVGYTSGFFPSSAVLNRTTRIPDSFHHTDDGFLEPLYRELAVGRELDLPMFRRHFYQPPTSRTLPGSLRFCEVTTESAVSWIARTPDPLFAVIHFIEPHYPYWPPLEWRVSSDPLDPANYHASLRHLDTVCLGRLADVLRGRGSEALVVITSDHGEYWGTHGFRPSGDHGDLYQEVLAVPLVFWGSGTERLLPTRSAPWSHLDLSPTILGLLGQPSPSMAGGVDRSASGEEWPRPSWEDAAFNDPNYVAAMGGFRRGGVAVRMGRYKLIHRTPELGGPELYDLAADPGERRNLVDLSPAAHRTIARYLPPPIAYAPRPMPEVSSRLAALGYL
ncbi:MAG: sulfatase-like hydrolase/transferase [Candidatus Eisenbacteria bacterium]|jgi:arylsulfatase A-like enzyme|nr:sulfatase-like hydrolase/transferase [Candidatus Eisenbacteria bacterium]